MEDAGLLTGVLLPLALAVVMGSLGLALTPADFRRIFVVPKGVLIGLANLLAISPLLAFVVADLYDLTPALAVGLVLLGASPGGTMANMLTHLARGDTALSVTMTALSSLAAVATVPLYLGLAIDHFDASGVTGDVSMLGVVARVFLITIVPLSIGMWIRAHRRRWVMANEGRVRQVAVGAFVAVVVAAVASEWALLRDNFSDVALAALTLNLLAMTVSFTIARLARLDDRQSTAIAMELGVHNGTLAITVGATIATALTIPAAVYSAFMFITAGLFARAMYRRNARGASPTAALAEA
jgi:BASS family bile acid:Na+ symporter